MKLVILATGIPGSGKTTALSALRDRYQMGYVSRDDIREAWFGNPHLQIFKKEVRGKAEALMWEALASDQPVLLDSTFANRGKRRRAIAVARTAGATRVIGIVFTTPLEKAKERNRNRVHSVKEWVIDMMHHELTAEPPSLRDGFDALYTSDQLDELERDELAGRL
jgi:predicted kinase